MDNKQVKLTEDGLKQLEEELEYLKTKKRKEVSEKIFQRIYRAYPVAADRRSASSFSSSSKQDRTYRRGALSQGKGSVRRNSRTGRSAADYLSAG